jgi:hypothetical protein
MPLFNSGRVARTPFGKNTYLRSTVGCKFESYTFAANSLTSTTIDGVAGQKVLQPGTVIAKITSGPDSGKVGVYEPAGTAEVQTATKAGTVSGGTFTLSFGGQTTTAIAWDAVAATVQAALEALSTIGTGNVVVTGGPLNSGPFTITFAGNLSGNQAQITSDATLLTGAGAGVTMATSTPGVAGAIDGRQTSTNLVGLVDTFLPWQLMEGDREVAVMYIGTAVAAWCLVAAAGQASYAAPDATQQGYMRSVAGMDITFK